MNPEKRTVQREWTLCIGRPTERAEAEAAAAAAVVKETGKKAKGAQKAKAAGGSPSGTTIIAQQAQNTELPQDLDEWEPSKGGLPEGSNLSSSKALLE